MRPNGDLIYDKIQLICTFSGDIINLGEIELAHNFEKESIGWVMVHL